MKYCWKWHSPSQEESSKAKLGFCGSFLLGPARSKGRCLSGCRVTIPWTRGMGSQSWLLSLRNNPSWICCLGGGGTFTAAIDVSNRLLQFLTEASERRPRVNVMGWKLWCQHRYRSKKGLPVPDPSSQQTNFHYHLRESGNLTKAPQAILPSCSAQYCSLTFPSCWSQRPFLMNTKCYSNSDLYWKCSPQDQHSGGHPCSDLGSQNTEVSVTQNRN